METLPTPASPSATDSTGLLTELAGDGRPLLALVALGLVLSGLFALFLSATGAFLPHDVAFLGMQPRERCTLHQCRIVHFIFHDRVSFGGTLIAIGTLYLWLLAFPLRFGEEWAWWTLLLSGVIGFLSFLAYLIYGYLDSWHAVASAALLPLFIAGMAKTHRLLPVRREGWRSLVRPAMPWKLTTRAGVGRACLFFVGSGMTLAGSVIIVLRSKFTRLQGTRISPCQLLGTGRKTSSTDRDFRSRRCQKERKGRQPRSSAPATRPQSNPQSLSSSSLCP
jgi:hypothetical protein